jgi:hypothetical protein
LFRITLIILLYLSIDGKAQNLELSDLALRKSLSEEDLRILDDGPMGNWQYAIGGVVGLVPGFGLGHAIQGRWQEKGWIFSVGQVGSIAAYYGGAVSCFTGLIARGRCNGLLLASGAFGFIFFKVWEVIDIWYGGHQKRLRYDQLHKKHFASKLSIAPLISPGGPGLQLSWSF